MRDHILGDTIDVKFTTRQITGAPFTLAGSPAIAAYPDNGTTEITAGITLTTDFDSRTGLNNVRVVASSGNGYASGSTYQLVLTAGTVNGVSVVGEVVGEFNLGRAPAYVRLGAPAGASIAADIAAIPAAVWAVGTRTLTSFGSLVSDIWANATRTLTAISDSSGVTTLLSRMVGTLATGTHNPQTGDAFARLGAPAGASVSADIAAVNAKTTNLPADPADASDVLAATTAIAGYVDTEVGAIKAVTDKLDTAVELDGAVYRFTTNALEQAPTGGSAPTAAAIADAVWDEAISGHLTGGSTGSSLNGAGSAGDPWTTTLPGAYGAGTAGKILGDNLNATVGSRATQTSVDTIDDFLDTEVAAIKAKTDALPSDPADASDVLAATTTIAGYLDTEIAAIKAKTDLIPSDPADQSAIEAAIDAAEAAILAAIPSASANATALLDTSNGVETSITPRQALRLILSAAAGKTSGAGTTTFTIRNVGDTKTRITATTTLAGDRTAITTDAT